MAAITSSLSNLTAPQLTKSLDKNEPAVETQSNNEQKNSTPVANEPVNLSSSGIKLSSSTPVQSSDIAAPIENSSQAQQLLNKLIADFQNNPSLAQAAHSNIFSDSVKSLLG